MCLEEVGRIPALLPSHLPEDSGGLQASQGSTSPGSRLVYPDLRQAPVSSSFCDHRTTGVSTQRLALTIPKVNVQGV